MGSKPIMLEELIEDLPGNAFHNPTAIKTHPTNPMPMETTKAVDRS